VLVVVVTVRRLAGGEVGRQGGMGAATPGQSTITAFTRRVRSLPRLRGD
jgi:hypothetical protein